MNQHFDVLIIGAGLSGIGTACHVTAEFPDKTIALLERRERLGGTWDLFRYPGVRSDSDMFTFGYKFRPWRDVKVLADGASIRQYIADTATEFGVDEKIHYGLKVNTAEWSSRQCRWTVAGVHEATGETRTYTCDYLISCTGYYNYDAGYLPDFPGVHRFGGRCVHPQHWPEDLDYSGKKVVVIGSGATAVTLVPAMAGSNPGSAAHVTMLQRSPSYIFSLPAVDKISEVLGRFLPDRWVYEFGRRRNIAIQRKLYQACRRWPKLMRRLLLWEVRRRLGRSVDMSNFTPNYLPWDERLCAVPNGDLFKTLASGAASVVTDQIETFTEKGILCKSGREIEADIIVTATGLNIQMLGGMRLIVDGAEYQLPEKMTYKGVLLENAPNLAWIIGYTNASWTLKSDIAGAYLCRLLRHMADNGYTVATPRDAQDCALDVGMFDQLNSGYVKRGQDIMPRQGSKHPWRVQPPHAATSGTLIYLHGGAYALGSARGYRGLAAQLAAAAGMTALVPDYTRAPHAHYPVALEEMAAVYTRLLDDGLDPKTTVIAGDSAGGGLTLALAMALRDRGIQAPAALGLICPWADLAVDIEATRPALRDPLILPSMCTEWAPRYVGSSDPRLPGISPVYGDMSGLPPIVMQTAGDDPICVDADKIETACAASKTSIEHRRFAGMWHDFHLQVSLLPEARDAIADLGARLRGHLHQSQGQPRGVVK